MEAKREWLEDPRVYEVNRLDAHSDHSFYESEEELRRGVSGLIQPLNGTWRFKWSANPAERPADFYRTGASLSGFGEITVPGHMELQGYGQIHYINTMYPWEGHACLRPPHVDWEHDPVGSYVLEFDLKPQLQGRRVCISFQGVEEAFYVWLNGEFVGYAEDSFTPSDFDLTPYVKKTGNRLCVEVYKRSSAAWIEDQDFFRFSGIFRDVFLYAKPELHLEDLWARTELLPDLHGGRLKLCLKLSCEAEGGSAEADPGQVMLEVSLRDAAGSCLLEERVCPERDEEGGFAAKSWELPEVTPWCCEQPCLYELLIKVCGREGRVFELVPCRVGFRRFELADRVMYLNGKRLIINGVNRHEWNPCRGRAITREDMLKDIEILKRNRINAVRTCHYPNQSAWYDLCDENGILLMDEANLESHGSWQKLGKCEPSWNVPGSLPEWEDCVVDRARSMLERDKNHVSILFWSCGNESYAGTCIQAMSDYFRQRDPSRLVHYEGVFWNRRFEGISDVESRMYAAPEEIRAYLENDPKKPFILCEYMHDMGNSLGGMESYIRLLEEYPMYQGGFIWDFIDQAVFRRDVDGRQVLGYGGDFLDRPSDYSFSGDGLLFADREEKPAMQEVRFWYMSPEEREAFLARQRELAEESRQRLLAETGADRRKGRLKITRGDVVLGVAGEDVEILFSRQEHGPVSLVCGGREWLFRAPMPALWRAPTENDKGNGFPGRSAAWMGADACPVCRSTEVEEGENRVKITYVFETQTAPGTEVKVVYTVVADGSVLTEVSYSGRKGMPELPVFGLRFLTERPVEEVRWTGLSGETYPDRKKGGAFGTFAEKPHIPAYLVPQESGCHMDTQRLQLWYADEGDGKTGGRTSGLEIAMAERPFAFSALPYTPGQLEAAFHREELPLSRHTAVTVMGAVRGVGGIDSWGADVEPDYRIPGDRDICFSFWMRKAREKM